MPAFTVERGAHTPATNQDNYTLDANTTGDVMEVVAIGWGGRLTTSTGYRTRWVRPSTAGTGIFTALTEGDHNPGYGTPLGRAGTYATAPVLGTDPAGNLFAVDWNAHGGLGYVALPLAAPWKIIAGVGQGQISCRNIAGTDASGSNYSATWQE